MTEICGVDDNNNQKRQKVYNNFGFSKAVLMLEVENTTEELELELNEATASNKNNP